MSKRSVLPDRSGLYLLVLVLIAFGLFGWWSSTSLHADEPAIEVPPRFVVRTVVSGLTLPTDMVQLPSGDFLVTEKGVGEEQYSTANVRLVRQGVLQPEPVLTLGVNEKWESGLFSILLDPDFATNHYFYLWYSTGEGSLRWNQVSFNRLSRFTYDDASGKADAASETIIIDRVRWGPRHNGGATIFDEMGNIVVTTGDTGARATFVPGINIAQDPTTLNGKVLRIRPRPEGGYDIPSDNPFIGVSEVRPEIYALGLRSPFRMIRRQRDQSLFIADVGEETWEELNLVTPGANYGWPIREGKCPIYERGPDCAPAPAEFTDPLLTYIHPVAGGAALTALAFYEGTQWPAEYQGKLFFADFDSNWINTTDIDDPNAGITPFATGFSSLVDMLVAPEGIYTLSIYEGRIQLIYFAESGNLPPVAQWQLSATSGVAPLVVTFTAAESQDENGDALSYDWDFGDGNEITTTTPSATHIYMQDGDYLATLQVTDGQGAQSEILAQMIRVYSGAYATIVQENLTQPGRGLYYGGDQMRFHALREGGTSGLDAATPYVWTILLHHHNHAHTLLSEHLGSDVLLELPTTTHALNVPLWYEIQLAMHTASGQVLHSTYELHPQTSTIQTESWPGPAEITLNGSQQEAGNQVLAIAGQEYVLEAQPTIFYAGKVGQFKNWIVTNGWPQASGIQQSEIVTERRYAFAAGEQPKAFVAYYAYVGPISYIFLPAMPHWGE